MIDYLKNLLPRLQEFSSNLDKKEVFIDKQWIYFDDDGNQHSYIFKRDGRLIMSINGDAQTGKWEFLPEAHSLHIDRIKDQILLNQALIFDGLMMLKKDGSTTDPWVLINKQVIPDLNYADYLKNLMIEKMQLKAFKLNDGKTYYYDENNLQYGLYKGCRIYDENFNQLTGTVKIGYGQDKALIINDGFLTGIIYQIEYTTDRGVITIFQKNLAEISLRDEVYQNSISADGFYQFIKEKNHKSIEVKSGKIISIKYKQHLVLVWIILSIIFLAVLAIILNSVSTGTKSIIDSSAHAPDTTTAPPAAPAPESNNAAKIDSEAQALEKEHEDAIAQKNNPAKVKKASEFENREYDKGLLNKFRNYLSDESIIIKSFSHNKNGVYIVSPLINNVEVRRLEKDNPYLFSAVLIEFKKITFNDDFGGNVVLKQND